MCKIVTICGSMKFQNQMAAIAGKLELEEKWAVIPCVCFDESRQLNPSELRLLGELHRRKIEISDAIFVMNAGGYIGQSTQREIEYARSLGKEVLFLEPMNP